MYRKDMYMGQLIADQVKQISEGEATYALREAWKLLYNQYPSLDSLALLWAQWALETGRGKAIHCYNFGNIKRSGDEDYCMYRCNEMLNGKWEWFDPPHKQTWFRAYSTAVDGAYDYIKFLSQKTRYQKAWAQVKLGDPAAFSHELKVAGYYTAIEAQYTKGVVKLTTEFKKKAKELLMWAPSPEERRSQLPTIVPNGDIPLEVWAAPTFPDIDLDYHPEQENPKPIPVPGNPIIELLFKIMGILKDLL